MLPERIVTLDPRFALLFFSTLVLSCLAVNAVRRAFLSSSRKICFHKNQNKRPKSTTYIPHISNLFSHSTAHQPALLIYKSSFPPPPRSPTTHGTNHPKVQLQRKTPPCPGTDPVGLDSRWVLNLPILRTETNAVQPLPAVAVGSDLADGARSVRLVAPAFGACGCTAAAFERDNVRCW